MAKTFRMNVALAMAIAVLGVGSVAAQDTETRTVEQYTCKDIMREQGANRDVAIAFLHGFLLGKSGTSSFKLDALHKRTAAFIELCLDNPAEKAVNVLSKIKD